MRKDMARIFCAIQGRFRILRRESELWSVEDVVLVSEVCAIIHNLLVHMRQSGALDFGISEEDDQFDIIC